MSPQPKRKAERVVLAADVRGSGGNLGDLRREGKIPGVVYGQGEGAVSIQVAAKELVRILKSKAGGNALIQLKFGDSSKAALKGHKALAGDDNVVLIKELQQHPVTHNLLHVDFHQVSLTEKITVNVPLTFDGEAIGVKQDGGVLEHLRWELEVECLPTDIPAEISLDISQLSLGTTLHVKDLKLPEGVKSLTDSEQPIIACVEPRPDELPAAAAEGAEAPTEPEVLKQKKPEEEGAEGAAEGKGPAKEKEKAAEPAKKG